MLPPPPLLLSCCFHWFFKSTKLWPVSSFRFQCSLPPSSSLAASIGSSKAQNSGLLARFRIKVAHNSGLSSFSFCLIQNMRGKGGGAPLSGCSDQGPYLPLGKGDRAPITWCCRGGSLAGSLSLLVSVSGRCFSPLPSSLAASIGSSKALHSGLLARFRIKVHP